MDEVFAGIRDALTKLRDSTQPFGMFGSQSHGFQLHPTLTEDAVREFEQIHRVTLPAEYRGFLLKVGNGGAGPSYGLFKLGEMDDGPWQEGDGFIGNLSEPFPHSEPWNDLFEEPLESLAKGFDIAEYEAAYELWDAKYWSPTNVNGAVPICHLGCAYREWLVITGPEAGNVWCDVRVDRAGLQPVAQTGKSRVSFLQWYQSWLDDTLSLIQ